MTDAVFLWAQWGILNHNQYQIVKEQFGDLETAWKKIDLPFLMEMGFGRDKAQRVLKIREAIPFQCIDQADTRVLCVDDKEYPAPLKSIGDSPPFLFVRGQLPALHKSLGVVGTRQITQYGKMATEKLVTDLVASGFVIVSGLALGVDALAHETAVKHHGITLAALGCGVDRVFPACHGQLAERIVKSGGAILSEYPLGTPALQHHFPVRNRIISGLSKGVLVIEGGVKSGALITARYALEQGREVFAVPNDITKIGLSGTNHLIRRGEAKLIEGVDHILEEFQMQASFFRTPPALSTIESELLGKITNEGKSIDELARETAYNVARLSEVLIHLQLKGIVRQINQKWVMA